MKIEALKSERIEDFVNYCKKHKMEIDESFLHDEDLKDFKPDNENPTYVAVDEKGEIKAAVSLIIDDYNRRGRRARYRIFHSEIDDIECYSMLLQAVLKHTEGLDKVFIFVPVVNEKLMKFIEDLKFKVERYSFLLIREDSELPEVCLPEDYEIRSFKPGHDERYMLKLLRYVHKNPVRAGICKKVEDYKWISLVSGTYPCIPEIYIL